MISTTTPTTPQPSNNDAGLSDVNTTQASERISSTSSGSRYDAAMVISLPKTKAMHIHEKTSVSYTTEEEIIALNTSALNAGIPRGAGLMQG